jgi:hypothetical protein
MPTYGRGRDQHHDDGPGRATAASFSKARRPEPTSLAVGPFSGSHGLTPQEPHRYSLPCPPHPRHPAAHVAYRCSRAAARRPARPPSRGARSRWPARGGSYWRSWRAGVAARRVRGWEWPQPPSRSPGPQHSANATHGQAADGPASHVARACQRVAARPPLRPVLGAIPYSILPSVVPVRRRVSLAAGSGGCRVDACRAARMPRCLPKTRYGPRIR